MVAFDNFYNTDRNSLSCTKQVHDTAVKIFQIKSQTPITQSKKEHCWTEKYQETLKAQMSRTCLFWLKGSKSFYLPDSSDAPPDLCNSVLKISKIMVLIIIMGWNRITDFWTRCPNYASHIFTTSFKPVTDYLTLYTVMLNMVKIANKLIARFSQYTVMRTCFES